MSENTGIATDLHQLWQRLLETVGRTSVFTRSYLMDARPLSFENGLLRIGFGPEIADQINLVNNTKTYALLKTGLAELGHPNAQIKFVRLQGPPVALESSVAFAESALPRPSQAAETPQESPTNDKRPPSNFAQIFSAVAAILSATTTLLSLWVAWQALKIAAINSQQTREWYARTYRPDILINVRGQLDTNAAGRQLHIVTELENRGDDAAQGIDVSMQLSFLDKASPENDFNTTNAFKVPRRLYRGEKHSTRQKFTQEQTRPFTDQEKFDSHRINRLLAEASTQLILTYRVAFFGSDNQPRTNVFSAHFDRKLNEFVVEDHINPTHAQ